MLDSHVCMHFLIASYLQELITISSYYNCMKKFKDMKYGKYEKGKYCLKPTGMNNVFTDRIQ